MLDRVLNTFLDSHNCKHKNLLTKVMTNEFFNKIIPKNLNAWENQSYGSMTDIQIVRSLKF